MGINEKKEYRAVARYSFLSAAGAAEEENEGDDDEPGAVIVKEMAKAVVHKKVLRKIVSGAIPLRYHSMAVQAKA